jgi:hypothetical protein
MLWRQPVSGHDDRRTGRVGQRPGHAVGGVDCAQNPAATEEVEQGGRRPLATLPVQPYRQFAAGPVDGEVDDFVYRLRVTAALSDRGQVRRPGLGQRHRVQRRNIVAFALVAHRLQLRVEGHGSLSHWPVVPPRIRYLPGKIRGLGTVTDGRVGA